MPGIGSIIGFAFVMCFMGFIACLSLYIGLSKNNLRQVIPL